MAAPDHGLSFEPRTRADLRRRLIIGVLSLVLWLAGIATVIVVLGYGDVIGTAIEFTGACFVFALVWLSLVARARRRRQFANTSRR
jgi:hypothetical protein